MSWTDTLSKDPAGASLLDTQTRSATFIISPREFSRANIRPPLSWKSVSFAPSSKGKVPQEPGLYAFVVRIQFPGLPMHGWVLYIGQTGHGSSGATLRSRFGQYLDNKRKPRGRHKVFYMLNAWDGSLEFFYAPEPARKAQLKKLETQLLGAFRPPFTDLTYPAAYLSPSNAF